MLVQKIKIKHQLVFIGDFDNRSGTRNDLTYKDRLFNIAEKYDIIERLKFLGYIPNTKVRPFFKEADIYIQPSFHETFGKTTIEAMLCGCPVVGANTSSTPEIIEDVGLLFDPYSPEDLANKIESILTNPHLRMNLINKGKNRAKNFTMDTEARQFIQVFNECHKNPIN